MQPFHQPYEPYKAGVIRPDVLEADELKQFPHYAGLVFTYCKKSCYMCLL